MGKTSSGTDMRERKGRAMICPRRARKIPPPMLRTMALPTVWRISLPFFCPMKRAIVTFAPTEIPMKRLIRMPMTGVLLPTAAIAYLLAKRPTIMMSVALKSCWRMPVMARGMAKKRILSEMEPVSKSAFVFISCCSLGGQY